MIPLAKADRNGGGAATIALNGSDDLSGIARRRFDESICAVELFFASEADAVSAAALDMARHFERGGRLLVFGEGADATDAQHVSVEFVHPVIVGKRALPAIALSSDVATLSAGPAGALAASVRTFGRPTDIAMGIATGQSVGVERALETASSLGMLTIYIGAAKADPSPARAERHRFVLPGADVLIAQEVAETLYHVLWELVHLFLEHGVAETRQVLSPVPAT